MYEWYKAFVPYKKAAVATALCLLTMLTAGAASVSEREALLKAKAFVSERGLSTALPSLRLAAKSHRARTAATASDYYVFNIGSNDGFVIVSGDDRTEAILGYADSGNIADGDMPEALKYFLDGYSQQMAWLDSQEASLQHGAMKATAAARTPIKPLVKTKWNQGSPYNLYCPTMTNANGEEEHTVTGCVATAMAQLMYFTQWPTSATTTIPAYTTKSNGLTVAALPATTFSWGDMSLTYNSDDTGMAAEAVATLMQYCGAALQMDYGLSANGGSSAYNVSIAYTLREHFGYAATTRLEQRRHYSYAEWVALIYGELAAGRPVGLGGQSAGGGHSFVCDGYDSGDYFHINWGWGGKSDGYFRLSALNPYEQGIGGSSTLDGFSFSQDAVVGIARGDGTTPPTSMTLELIRFGSSDFSGSKTYTRQSGSDAFTGLTLYLHLCNYSLITDTYDYAVQMIDESGTIVQTLAESYGHTQNFNTDWVADLSNLSTNAGLTNGTYTIRVMSRVSGAAEWQESFGNNAQQLTAVVSGNTMTVTPRVVVNALPTYNSLTVSGNLTQGYEQEVSVSVKGGAADYHGNLLLYVNGKRTMGKQVDIPAGEDASVSFSFIPSTSGTVSLKVYAQSTMIGESSVVIAQSDATDGVALTFATNIDNLTADGKLYANALRATVTATNASTTNSYAGYLNCSVRKWTVTVDSNNDETWSWESVGVPRFPLVVAKEGSTTTTIAIDNLEPNTYYSFRITYRNTSNENNLGEVALLGQADEQSAPTLTTTDGYRIGAVDGSFTLHSAESKAIDAGSACYVDLTAMTDLSGISVTADNPNCLFFVAADATVPAALNGKNVVKGDNATALTLADGHSFYSPVGFTAQTATYSRVFTLPAAGSSGWNTIILPFDVDEVKCNGSGVDWFRSAQDTGKNFWMKTFTGDTDKAVYFDHAAQMKANTPYIIAVPGDTWGDDYKMTGKTVTFSGSNVTVGASALGALSGNSYQFQGSTAATTQSDVYLLDSNGSRFVKTQTATAVAPFRAWIRPAAISSLAMSALRIASGHPTDIHEVTDSTGSNADCRWHTLDGRQLGGSPAKPGIYISNGLKVIVR